MSVEPKRILVRGVNWLGDAVMTTPAMFRLRERFPQAHITLLTPDKLAGLWENQSWLNEVITFSGEDSLWSVGKKLRAGNFDMGLILPNSTRSALELWLGRVGNRTGYGGRARSIFLNRVVERIPGMVPMRKRSVEEIKGLIAGKPDTAPKPTFKDHQMHHYLHLVGALGAKTELLAPKIEVSAAERVAVLQKFGISTNGKLLLGLNVGAEYGPAKRWPVENFIHVARQVSESRQVVWLVFGGKGDKILAGKLEAGICSETGENGPQVVNLAGRTNLRELTVLLGACRAVLTNDTGPMHVAAASGTHVFAIFGSTSPELTMPGLPTGNEVTILKGNVPCAPCFLRECPIDSRCLISITVDDVCLALNRVL
ncbi:MAG TPA: lipopolysaccharide heptosyltransferase II [Verrucomicrobiae bacterium]